MKRKLIAILAAVTLLCSVFVGHDVFGLCGG